ncbi:hypothetical protein MVLG_04314 [Microbotryum lychnidis-dioicae p1A1 Lamole]|uniref:Holocytochrome c-type synthase n=1 Tax=Microbotryum lychnidis-dioicae (strain p1A1 Lamole / MvSl-1064) TaxID=683840 RepID=U5HAU8_USTV1|nr:hypothetical protein MVLG_04314 [Microbotryum lychnidis-dioicae p1A1 Lamole]|eukprot:KDE05282.1 hypothetical protein MVLG_04314 [Microbotryum lychnidis-dioicae p1A1 Lamole]
MWPFTSNAEPSTSSEPIPESACPVDRSTRSAWVKEAQQHEKRAQTAPSRPPTSQQLSTEREVSSIPRWLPNQSTPSPSTPTPSSTSSEADPTLPPSACPAHSTSVTAKPTSDSTSPTTQTENWVYPSPSSFYSALQRKARPANASDMPIVVPIHNAVNEKVWQDVLDWERLALGKANGEEVGSKLVSFVGKPKDLSPRARWKSLIGYTPPFDRHDWIVDRPLPPTPENPSPGSIRVRYVIDFYSGRGASLLEGGSSSAKSRTDMFTRPSLAFFIDCRPALDGWEGVRMRIDKVRENWLGSSRKATTVEGKGDGAS